MKKRIRLIFILMIVCILGIIAVQGYWLYNAWHIAYDQFGRSINSALGAAVGRKGFVDVKNYLRSHPSANPADDSVFHNEKNDTTAGHGDTRYFRKSSRREAGSPAGFSRVQINALAPRHRDRDDPRSDSSGNPANPYWYFISERLAKEPYRLSNLDTFFREELHERGVQTKFSLDTQGVDRAAFRDKDFRRQWRDHSKLQTHWMRINPVNDVYVRATFQTPYGYLFGKLLWILAATLILLALTTWCFIYMLHTILQQKRWSDIKNDFISNMTHELKTPIATVSAAVEALQHFQGLEDKDKTQSYLDISQHELKRLSDLVEKVLHISVEENEDMVLQQEKVNMEKLINGIIAGQQIKASKEVRFDFKCNPADLTLQVDRLHFSNAVNNLIDNAVKYSHAKVNIRIAITRKEDQCIFTIKDDGLGIPGHYQNLIFDKFFRVPTGDLHNVKGFGLGLSYVKKVVEKHGGAIRVKSEPDKGTEFTITLPNTRKDAKDPADRR